MLACLRASFRPPLHARGKASLSSNLKFVLTCHQAPLLERIDAIFTSGVDCQRLQLCQKVLQLKENDFTHLLITTKHSPEVNFAILITTAHLSEKLALLFSTHLPALKDISGSFKLYNSLSLNTRVSLCKSILEGSTYEKLIERIVKAASFCTAVNELQTPFSFFAVNGSGQQVHVHVQLECTPHYEHLQGEVLPDCTIEEKDPFQKVRDIVKAVAERQIARHPTNSFHASAKVQRIKEEIAFAVDIDLEKFDIRYTYMIIDLSSTPVYAATAI